jgi:hypothetical protein
MAGGGAHEHGSGQSGAGGGRSGGAQPGPGGPAGQPADPGALLSELAGLRRRTRASRHAYWFPLLLFGLLTCAAAPLYVAAAAMPARSGSFTASNPGPLLLGGMASGPNGFYLGWYWAAALTGGYLLTVFWYWRNARRAGVRTPARGYVITGLVLTLLAAALPWLTTRVPGLAILWLPFGDAWIRGTFAFLIIAAGLWVLTWAERSRVLAVIAAVYTVAALLASLYDVENILFYLGWFPRSAFAWQLTVLPGVLLPALVLLAAGTGALLAQRRRVRA